LTALFFLRRRAPHRLAAAAGTARITGKIA